MVDPLVDGDGENQTLARLAKHPELLRHHPFPIDDHTGSDSLQGFRRGLGKREDVIFLAELIARMHHPVRDFAVVGQQQQSLSLAIETTDGIDAFRHPHEFHHGGAAALIVGGGDEATRFVQDDVAKPFGSRRFAIDGDFGADRVDLSAERRDDDAVDAHPALADQIFGRAARCDAAGGEDPLQPFHDDGSTLRRAARGQCGRSVATDPVG